MTEIKVGNIYKLVLRDPWKLSHDVLVMAVAPRDTSSIFGGQDIYGTYFEPFDLSMGQYLTQITSDTPFYLCRKIESRNPISYEKEPSLVLPEPLIDINKSIELLETNEISFTIGPYIRYYGSEIEKIENLDRIENELRSHLKRLDELSSENPPIQLNTSSSIYDRNEVEEMINYHLSIIAEKRSNAINQALDSEQRDRAMVAKMIEMDAVISASTNTIQLYTNRLNEVLNQQSSITLTSQRLDRAKIIMSQMLEKVKNGVIQPNDITTFEDIYSQVSLEIL